MPRARCRLAIRAEDRHVNAYYAPELDSMEGAQLIGSILRVCCDDSEVFEAFKHAMTLAFAFALKEAAGIEVAGFSDRPAPENERAGDA